MPYLKVDDRLTPVRSEMFFGGALVEGGIYEYLYRLSDARWVLNVVDTVKFEVGTNVIAEDDAVRWLIRRRLSPEPGTDKVMVPEEFVPREEWFAGERMETYGPPPIGQHVAIVLPRASRTGDAVAKRQEAILQPGRVLEALLWLPPSDITLTAGFASERHEPMLVRLRGLLEECLVDPRPLIRLLQSLQDRGVDLLLEWTVAKYGVQLKSNGDVEEKDFTVKTLAQITDSEQYGLERLYVIIAADITGNSNRERVRQLEARISSMNRKYAIIVPPERAWTLLDPARGQVTR